MFKLILNNNDWYSYNDGKSIGQKGSENGIIIYDVEHSKGARITLEKETDIAPNTITMGIYGIMFHTIFSENENTSKNYIIEIVKKIQLLFDLLGIPEERQDENWQKDFDEIINELVEL